MRFRRCRLLCVHEKEVWRACEIDEDGAERIYMHRDLCKSIRIRAR
jgi:hypothetical protein